MPTRQSYFADTAVLVLKDNSGTKTYIDSSSAAIVAKGVEINGEFELVPLYGQDSIVRADIARKNFKVTVRIRYAKFTGELLGAIAGTETADTDIDGNAATGRTQISVTDSNTVPLFDLWATVSNGSDTFKAKVTNIAFSNLPFNLPEGEWIQLDLQGEGDLIYFERAS
ncbi:hypothetical protein [Candidatus Pyrohabitans sp.]